MKLRDILGVLRDAYCRTIGIEYMHIQDPEQKRWIQERSSAAHDKLPARSSAHPREAQRGRGVRDVPADQVRRPEAVRPRGRRVGIPMLDARSRGAADADLDEVVHRHGPPRPAQRAGQHRRQELRPDLPRVRGQHRPDSRPGLRRREVPPRADRASSSPAPARRSRSSSPPTRVHLEAVDPVVEGIARAKQDLINAARRSPCCRSCWCTATPRSPARAWWPRRSTSRSSRATAPAARSTWSSTTRSASPPRPSPRARRCTAPTSPRWSRRRSST
jgi:2-oxoglutarate decarboxylase